MRMVRRSMEVLPCFVERLQDTPEAAVESNATWKVTRDDSFAPIPIDEVNPNGVGPTEDGSIDRAPGFLRLGGDRLSEAPAMCTGA